MFVNRLPNATPHPTVGAATLFLHLERRFHVFCGIREDRLDYASNPTGNDRLKGWRDVDKFLGRFLGAGNHDLSALLVRTVG